MNQESASGNGPSGWDVRNSFRNEGDYWLISFDGLTVRLHDARGLRYLARLLQQPGTSMTALALAEAARVHPLAPLAASGPAAAVARGDRERARIAVSKAIKTALDRIATVHPALANHLQVTVHRGYACSYTPDPRLPIAWETAAPVATVQAQSGADRGAPGGAR